MDAEKIASVRVVEQARLPSRPLDTRRCLKIMLSIIGLTFAPQFLPVSLATTADVERTLKLPVLASIPRLQAK
jgi:capsular polysaccharide biosynthesis protein